MLSKRIKDITGNRYGKLVVLEFSRVVDGQRACWKCRCDCGVEKEIRGTSLRRGLTISCGCHKLKIFVERSTKHGMHETPLYQIWEGMKDRCYNKNRQYYKLYGGRGILMCDSWRDDFMEFYRDMSPTWEKGLELDRIDNDKGYCKENCRWANRSVQVHNKRKKKGQSSNYIGVCFHKQNLNWISYISLGGKRVNLGSFAIEEDAAIAYDNASEKEFGDRPNQKLLIENGYMKGKEND